MTAVSASSGARWSSSIGWTPSSIASMPPGHDGERRPELVGHVGEQCPAVLARSVQALRHRVERRGEAADGRGPAWRDADIGFAVRESLRGLAELRERADRRCEHPDRERDRDDEDDDDRDGRGRRRRGARRDDAEQRARDPRREGGDRGDEQDERDDEAADEPRAAGPGGRAASATARGGRPGPSDGRARRDRPTTGRARASRRPDPARRAGCRRVGRPGRLVGHARQASGSTRA